MNTLRNLKQETFSTSAPSSMTSSLGGLIIVGDETQDGGVVRKLKDGVGAVCGYTLIFEQGIQEGTEYAALKDSGAQGQYRRRETAHSHNLGSAHQEVQDPVAKG